MGQQAEREKRQDRRAMGVGSITREEIVKWNKMTAQGFQTGQGGSDIPNSICERNCWRGSE